MRNRYRLIMLVLCLIPCMMLTASCAKKKVMSGDASLSETAGEEYPDPSDRYVQPVEEGRVSHGTAEGEFTQTEIAARQRFVNEDIYFGFDQSSLTAAAQAVLKRKADWLRRYPAAHVVIEGHCDERGTTEYNLALGDRRGESVKAYLMRLGVSPARMTTISYGEERPVDRGHNESAWARNRRAHFLIE